MSPELETKLVKRFPGIFADMYGNPMETCMAFGCECSDGWFDLLYRLCEDIEKANPPNTGDELQDFRVLQIKEKFGSLNFYYRGGNDKIRDLVSAAEKESYKICERCGSREDVTTAGPGWILTLCLLCREKKNAD